MFKTALIASNIYIESSALEHSNNLSSSDVHALGGKIDAVKNDQKGYGRQINSGMDFTR
jgi:hypothetical protein